MISTHERETRNSAAYGFHEQVHEEFNKMILPLLKNTPITQFSYMRFRENGQYLMICTHPTLYKFQFKHVKDNGIEFHKALLSTPENTIKIYPWAIDTTDPLLNKIKHHDMPFGVSIYRRDQDEMDGWCFATNHSYQKFIEFITNSQLYLDNLMNFSKSWIEEFLIKKNQKGCFAIFDSPLLLKNSQINTKPNNNLLFPVWSDKVVYLSHREKECLTLILKGYSYKQSALTLNLSPRTIETHLQNIKIKTGLNYKSELINFFRNSF